MTADEIARCLSKHHSDDFFMTQVKTGATYGNQRLGIFDAIAIGKSYNLDIRGYEIKVSRHDFIRDAKWENYLNYCNRFYFVCPEGLIDKDEVSTGLIWIVNEKIKIKKQTPHRSIAFPNDMFLYISLYIHIAKIGY